MPEPEVWKPTAKSRRCYHRVMSGVGRGGVLRFLTLTSSNESPDTCQRSWHTLIARMRRRNLIKGYIKVPEPSKNGKQHLHVLFRGSYIDQRLISQWWEEIHHAKVVDIRKVKYSRSPKQIACYMAKYLSKDNSFRYSADWGWVWRAFCKDWANLKRIGWYVARNGGNFPFSRVLEVWNICLRVGKPDLIYIHGMPP